MASLITRSIGERELDGAVMPFPDDLGEDISVSFGDPEREVKDGNALIEYLGDMGEDDPNAGAVVTFGEKVPDGPPPEDSLDHYANLAEFLSDTERHRLADDLIEMWEADEQSSEDWQNKLARGMEVIGFLHTKGDDLPFSDASDVTHPLIAEAVVQFNARACGELLPPSGPCKGLVMGEQTQEARDLADRIEDHMNYQMTEEDEGYYDEMDALFFRAPFIGEGYTKTYLDDLRGFTTTRFVRAEDVVLPYSAKGLANTTRYTVVDKLHTSVLKKHMATGLYRHVPMLDIGDEDINSDDMQRVNDEAAGVSMVLHRGDPRHIIGEMNVEYALPRFDEDDIPRPYMITVDRTNRTILAVYRNWKESDSRYRRQHDLVQYKYLPGLGARGIGLLHILGGLAEACTGSMRALLDSAAFATLQGGFKSKDAHVPGGTLTLSPGVWHDIDLSVEELSKAFYTPPFKEPSPALFQMYREMVGEGRRFAGTTENVVGDASNTGPVGTTVALIEQGTKVMSGIHKRMHRAMRNEFRIRARLNAQYLPAGERVFYNSANPEKFIMADDYQNPAAVVVPVSDPNIVSQTQRIAQAQALMERADARPDMYRAHRVEYRLLEALEVDDAEQYIRDPDKKHRFDAVTEGARVMAGLPVWAFPGQNHDQHVAIHMAQIEYFKTLPEEQGGPLIMRMTEHLAKTEGYRLYDRVAQAAGGQLPPIDLYDEDPKEDMPPQLEMMVTAQAAQFIGQLMAEIQANQPPPPEDAKTQAEIARDDAAFQQEQQQKQAAFESEEARKQQKWEADQAREQANADPNSAQENIMRAISALAERLTGLTSDVVSIAQVVQRIVPTPSNNQGVPNVQDQG